jgi:hypothetical protein
VGAFIGQTSQFQPAVVYDGLGTYHMLFVSQDSSNRLLYVTSTDGQNWTGGPFTEQTTHSAPAIALYQVPSLTEPGQFTTNLLVAILIANDPSNRILYSILDLNAFYAKDPALAWATKPQVSTESAHGVYAWSIPGPSPRVNLYFLANDDTGRLLQQSFDPVSGKTFE